MCLVSKKQESELGIVNAYKVFNVYDDRLYSAFYPATFGNKSPGWEYPLQKWISHKYIPNSEVQSPGFYSFKHPEAAFSIIDHSYQWNLTNKYTCEVYLVQIFGQIQTGILSSGEHGEYFESYISTKIKVLGKMYRRFFNNKFEYALGMGTKL